MSIETLVKNVNRINPIWKLEEDTYYQYNGNGDLFSKTFMFRVVKDTPEKYFISIEEQFNTILEKTYEFIDAINEGTIFKLGTAEELGLENFDIRDYLDDVETIEDYLEKQEKDEDEK